MLKKIKEVIKKDAYLAVLTVFIALSFFVALRLNIFRYNNFDFGKFDLGNMTQMVWNTLHGRVLYLTDYFGSDVPRWSMSHVDPILLLFVPVFAVFQHPLTLALAQLVIVVLSAYIVYELALLELDSKFSACALAVAFLMYPSMGFINGTMGFHGVTAAIPFFLGAFYLFEKMYRAKNFTAKGITALWVLLVIFMSGKEELPLYVFMFGLFVLFFRVVGADPFKLTFEWFKKYLKLTTTKLGLSMVIVGVVWFVVAFFVIIPNYAHYRVESYNKFVDSLNVGITSNKDVTLSNFFLGRYEEFGTSYKDIVLSLIFDNKKVIKVVFTEDNIENLQKTFTPVLFLPFANPFMLAIAGSDLLINYLASGANTGVAEIGNHRISMIIPVLFISTIYAISFFAKVSETLLPKVRKSGKIITIVVSSSVLIACFVTSSNYSNPMYLWFTQAVKKRVYARYDTEIIKRTDLKIGDVVKLSDLDVKDNECSNAIIKMIPNDVSVAGPDNLGDHLSMRETYAIFPALWDTADYDIVDVMSRKISGLLELSTNIVKDVTENVMSSSNYKLMMGCGNLFLFKKVPPYQKSDLLPIQERYLYTEKYSFDLSENLRVVDFNLPLKAERGVADKTMIVYKRIGKGTLDGFVLYMTYVNKKTGQLYQVANLPSFAISRPTEWVQERYYIENVDVALPAYLPVGEYEAFVSLSNKIKARSLYLGNLAVD